MIKNLEYLRKKIDKLKGSGAINLYFGLKWKIAFWGFSSKAGGNVVWASVSLSSLFFVVKK